MLSERLLLFQELAAFKTVAVNITKALTAQEALTRDTMQENYENVISLGKDSAPLCFSEDL